MDVGVASRPKSQLITAAMQRGGTEPRVLEACKHTDRAKNRCPEPLRVRPHKRGHLTAECAAGHQWVWCPLCCTCGKLGTNGCHKAAHWIERDCYDTGKRNHMQRHGPCQMPTNVLKAVALPEVCADWQSADCGARSVLRCHASGGLCPHAQPCVARAGRPHAQSVSACL